MSQDWYARKLSQPQPARQESTPKTFAPLPQQPTYPTAPPPVHPASPEYQAPQRFDDVEAYWQSLDPNTQDGKTARHQALLSTPKPGAGSRDARGCPNCHGSNFFSRRTGSATSERYPAPQCYDCGYPMVQSGSVGGSGGAAWS